MSSEKKDLFAAGRCFFYLFLGQKDNHNEHNQAQIQAICGEEEHTKAENITTNWPSFGSSHTPVHLQFMIWSSADRNHPSAADINKFGGTIVYGLQKPIVHVVGVCKVAPLFLLSVVVCSCASDKSILLIATVDQVEYHVPNIADVLTMETCFNPHTPQRTTSTSTSTENTPHLQDSDDYRIEEWTFRLVVVFTRVIYS